jgi:hypothetical protein
LEVERMDVLSVDQPGSVKMAGVGALPLFEVFVLSLAGEEGRLSPSSSRMPLRKRQ